METNTVSDAVLFARFKAANAFHREKAVGCERGTTAASVLVPLVRDPGTGEVCVLLTKRSAQLRAHAAEVCLPGMLRPTWVFDILMYIDVLASILSKLKTWHPAFSTSFLLHLPTRGWVPIRACCETTGGKADDGDADEEATALREAEEEIGLSANAVTVLGRLTPCMSRAGLLVSPLVGWVSPHFQPQLNKNEVDCCFVVPLHWFLDRQYHQHLTVAWLSQTLRLHEFYMPLSTEFMSCDLGSPTEGACMRVWGMTAMYVRYFL